MSKMNEYKRDYLKDYLAFIPQKYQDSFEKPTESFWKWNNHRIHIDSKSNETNKKTVIFIHGAGANGRILSLFGSYLFKNGINYYAPDNLGYGMTNCSTEHFDYNDWLTMLCDYVKYIQSKENNEVYLIGLSIGGMLAYQVASKINNLSGIIVTTLADPRDKATLIAMAKYKFLATSGLSLLHTFRCITDQIRLPIKWFCKMDLMSRNRELSKVFINDKLAGGAKISLRFLRTFAAHKPPLEFEEFDKCPILLLHPEKDQWTPFELSKKVFDKLRGNKEFMLLEECGHAPIEEPGIYKMEKEVLKFIK